MCPNHAAERLIPRKPAAIVNVFRIDCQNNAVLVQRRARVEKHTFVAVRARLHVLDARLDPLHPTPARFARSQSTNRHVRIACNLDPEAAANVETLHVNLVDAHAERRCQKLRRKGRKRVVAVILDVAGARVPVRHDDVALERRARKTMKVQSADVHDVGGLLEGFFDVAVFKNAVPVAVRAHGRVQETLVLQRVFCANNSRQWLVINFNQFPGVLRGKPGLRNHGSHRFTLKHNFVHRHWIIGNFLRAAGSNLDERLDLLLDFRAGQRANNSGELLGLRDINPRDLGMRVRRPDKPDMQHPGHFFIVNENAPPAHKAALFLAPNRLAHPLRGRGFRAICGRAMRRGARRLLITHPI